MSKKMFGEIMRQAQKNSGRNSEKTGRDKKR